MLNLRLRDQKREPVKLRKKHTAPRR